MHACKFAHANTHVHKHGLDARWDNHPDGSAMGGARLGQREAAFLPRGFFCKNLVHLWAGSCPHRDSAPLSQFPHGGVGPASLWPLIALGFEGSRELRGVMGEPRDLGESAGGWGGKTDPPGSN